MLLKKLKQNEQLSMFELANIVKKKYKKFNITPQHLGKVIRDNNLTRKRTRHEHFPIIRYGTPIEKQKELDKFYKEVDKYNRKTLDINKYKKYLKKKNEINSSLFDFYQQYVFRKLNLSGYMNRLRSEQRMINNFKKIFGKPEDVIVCFGDYEQRKHMKFKEPTKGKG